MPVDYHCPECPAYLGRIQGQKCPRSDTYRAFENGTVHNVFGWTFRCRTCGVIFFRASREAGNEGLKAGRQKRLMEAEAKRYG